MVASTGKPKRHDASLIPEAANGPACDANVRVSIGQEPVPRLPHERDESADSQVSELRAVIQQAAKDIQRGLVDTDRGEQVNRTYAKLKANPKP